MNQNLFNKAIAYLGLPLLFLVSGCDQHADKKSQPGKDATPATYVSTAQVKHAEYTPFVDSIGRLQANKNAALSLDNPGIVKRIHFSSGQSVKKGDVLLELDHGIENAKLDATESELTESQHLWSRARKLHRTHSISTAELEKARTQYFKAKTAKQLLETQIKHKSLVAPFSGKLGFKHTEIGEYLTPGKHIVQLLSLNPMRIVFSVPESYFPYLKQDQTIDFSTDPYPGRSFKAKIAAIDIETLDKSHLINIEGIVDNKENLLYPGLFTKLKLYYKKAEQVLTIPKTAINYNLYGNSVYTIHCDAQHRCEALEQFVTVGPSIGDDVIIRSGLKSGEQVIASGQLKVHNHSPVIVNNENEATAAQDVSEARHAVATQLIKDNAQQKQG